MPVGNLLEGFTGSTHRFPDRPALYVDGVHHTYAELSRAAGGVARAIGPQDSAPLAGLLAHRESAAYAGVLGILASGRGYVPLNPRFPPGRTATMVERAGIQSLVVGEKCLQELSSVLVRVDRPLRVIVPAAADVPHLERAHPQHSFWRFSGAEGGTTLSAPPAGPDALAYLLFTSGSTGEPKGVPVSQANVRAYVEYIAARYAVGPEDRLSQTFDLTFDLSVHDLFVAWERGACVVSIPEAVVAAPARFVRDQAVTMWFSVPSAVSYMARLRMLKPGVFPALRASLFCGEALPLSSVKTWEAAAPNSIIENLYGPTEATIAITHYPWDAATSPERCRNGVVPIGWAFAGQKTRVVDSRGTTRAKGESGELVLDGSQRTAGYWNDPDQTAERYVGLSDGGTWYRTGDLVVEEPDGCLLYLGRLDDQVKIRGYRAELQEIDAAVQRAARATQAVVVPWPVRDGSVHGVVAFVQEAGERDPQAILSACAETLLEHMIPTAIHFIDAFPLNVNGKVDRRALTSRLSDEAPPL